MNDEIKIEKDSGRDMTPRLIRDLGMRYPTEKSGRKHRYGLYECAYCGKEFEASPVNIKSGSTISCGCYRRPYNIQTHGLYYNKYYGTYNAMWARCFNPKNKAYKYYGGRGITICEEWLDITNFIAWVESTHPNIEGVSLDRIDVDGNYEPNNCRWADASTQALNKRMMKSNTSGYVGVHWDKSKDKWVASIRINNKPIKIGTFLTIEEAVQARDKYILENNLPHKLSTDYKKEN